MGSQSHSLTGGWEMSGTGGASGDGVEKNVTMLRQNGIEDLIERIERDRRHRVLRKLAVPPGRTGVPYNGGDTFIAAVIDVETTGLDPASDVIIELALRRFRYDLHGRILKIDRARTWREDPGRELSPEIIRLTGITSKDLEGQTIDTEEVERLLCTAHFIIAHNASFDRKFIERRLPGAVGLPWACSCREIDWQAGGFDGRSLAWLTAQAGWFYDGHRAENDVDAVIALLCWHMPDGQTALAELLDTSACPSVLIEAVGAGYAVKDTLRRRGYHWNPTVHVWWREVLAKDLVEEESWLALNVYGARRGGTALGPRLTEVTARERYA